MGEKRVKLIVNTISTMELDLDKVPYEGTVVVHPENTSGGAQACVLSSPNYAEIVSAFEEIQTEVGDYHHTYLEDIHSESDGEILNLYPVLGS